MKRCPNCKAEILFESTEFCEHCGVSLKDAANKPAVDGADDDRLEMTVTEEHDGKPDKPSSYSTKPRADLLGVQSSAEWLQDQQTGAYEEPIDTAPKTAKVKLPAPELQEVKPLASAEPPAPPKKSAAPKENYLSDAEKQALLKKMGEPAEKPTVSPSAKPDLAKPTMAKRGRGVAFYMKNYIQVQGEAEFQENDEIIINDRPYLLRKKTLTTKTLAVAASVGFLIFAAILVPMLVRDASGGRGSIVGMALDETNQPFIGGATIRLPETKKSVATNGQGFFRVDGLTPGTHRVEYVVGGQTVKVDYATVTAGDITTLTLFPGELAEVDVTQPVQSEQPSTGTYAREGIGTVQQTENLSRSSQPTRSAEPGFGQVTLTANVDGARLAIDGAVIGAGNLTYERIKAGSRKYSVTKDGYQPASGIINVPAGEAYALEVTLMPTAETQATLSLQQNFDQAAAYAKSGDADKATSLYSEILSSNPGHTASYIGRADVYASVGQKLPAHDDYLRAAEIYRLNGNIGEAMTAFSNAAKMHPKSVPALLGRASLHLSRNEEIAAIADYEAVLNIDKRNAQAHYGLGEARFSQGNYKLAIKHFKDAKSEDPANPIIYQYLMLCYFGDDDLKNVKKSYDKFKEMATQDQLERLHSDKSYSAVLRAVDSQQ